MQGNIRACHWQLNAFEINAETGNFRIRAEGHSSEVPEELRLSIGDDSFQVRPSIDEASRFGLKFDEIKHWRFELNATAGRRTDVELTIRLAGHSQSFLPYTFHTNVELIENVPDTENIMRVGGPNATQQSHLSNGRRDYYQFLDLIYKYAGDPRPGQEVLDWGIGCGRIARHFMSRGDVKVSGLDIDAVNIAWMRANLPEIDARLCETQPPSSFRADRFDFVVSFSVLSHLTPENWHVWLAELARLIRPGGLALLSFHGDHSASVYFGDSPDHYDHLMREGYYDHGGRHDIGAEHYEYYRDVFYTDAAATRLFKKVFELIEIAPCVVSGFQSIAVLRKR